MSEVQPRAISLSDVGRQLFESAPDAVVIIDREGTIRMVNEHAVTMFGYARDELTGQHLEILIPERSRRRHPSHRADYFANPTTRPMGAGLELAARRKDGTDFRVDIALSSLETEDGLLVSAAIRDITDWVRTTKEREVLEAQLRVHQAQRLESLGGLAGGIAHDFNNVLAAISTYCELIRGGLRGLPVPPDGSAGVDKLVHDIDQIRKATDRAAHLTHQLLVFSRREIAKPEILDVNETVVEMEKLLTHTIGEDVVLVTELADPAPSVEMDRGQLEQVLMNLVVNARDSMPHGGQLQIRTLDLLLDEGASSAVGGIGPGRYLGVTVSDTGTGMSREVIDRAFEPFFTTKDEGRGTGLGLATVYGIVIESGGGIAIYSEPEMGTSVKVYLPAAEGAPAELAEDLDVRSLQGTGETILFVEDEDMVREPASRLLREHGYTVIDSDDPREAVRLVADAAVEIHLLLTDVVMPGLTGKELAELVRETRPDIKTVFVSGYPQDVIAYRGAADPELILIEKPFTTQLLLRTIREVLDSR
ncbi:MAG TPA: PAS domain S-box protein [Actinomycetota bacterium]